MEKIKEIYLKLVHYLTKNVNLKFLMFKRSSIIIVLRI